MLQHLERNNVPLLSFTRQGLAALDSGECHAYIGHNPRMVPGILADGIDTSEGPVFRDDPAGGHYLFDGYIVSYGFWLSGYDKDWFTQSLEGQTLWVETYGSPEMMPYWPWLYVIAETHPSEHHHQVETTAATMGEVVAANYKYRLDPATGKFLELDAVESTKNLYRAWIKNEVVKAAGDVHSRIADYGRLIALLIQSSTLPTDTKDTLSAFMAETVDGDLAGINRRESAVQAILDKYKNGEPL